MPIYEYTCSDCKATFETVRKMSDEPLTECLICGKMDTVTKIFSQTAPPKFVGKGFYSNDYKGAKKPR